MEVKIIKDLKNEVFNRREIEFEVMHADSGTPDRFSVRKALASKAGSKLDNVYVLDILNDTGTDRSSGRADVYENRQVAEKTVPKHLLVRNMSPEDRAKIQKTEKEKKTEAKKAPEAKKPEEKKPGEKGLASARPRRRYAGKPSNLRASCSNVRRTIWSSRTARSRSRAFPENFSP